VTVTDVTAADETAADESTAEVTGAGLSGPEIEEARRMFALLRSARGTQPTAALRSRTSELGDRLLSAVSGLSAESRTPGSGELTPREIDVLAHAALGATNNETAERLGVSAETVKSYLHSAMGKLGAHSRCAAVARARAAGVIP